MPALRSPGVSRRWFVAGLTGLAAIGCGPRDTRVRNRVTGTITYGGKPVVAGEILLIPDGEQRNTGPEGIAIIKNGRFDTRGSRAPGIDGGPMVVEVTGFLDEKQKQIFSYSCKREFKRLPSMTLDIDVPTKAAPAMAADAVP
jgi:hypothetical protein